MIAKGMNILHFRVIHNDLARRHLILGVQFQNASLQPLHQFTRLSLCEHLSMIHKDDTIETHGFVHIRSAHQHSGTIA
jgi:hypothetical protein